MENIVTTSKIFTAFAKAKGFFQRIMGCVLIVIFGLCIIITLVDHRPKSVPGMIFCSLGVALGVVVLRFGNRTISAVRRCKRYAEVISDQNEVEVQQIADALSLPVGFVRQDLQKMIANRYFIGAQLDRNSQKISFADRPEKTKITGRSIIANFKRYPISTSAWLLLCLFVLFSLFICFIDFPGRFIVTILGAMGIVVSFLGTRFRSAERQWKYVKIIGRKKEGDINRIAKLMRCSADEVILELKDMIAKGLMNIQIDEDKKTISIVDRLS